MSSSPNGPASPSSNNLSARDIIQDAFETFEHSVSPNDARSFNDTRLQDVWSAAKAVEQKLAAKHSARNLKRIQPFLEGLDHYGKAVEVLCNGTPYLPWIWAPVKLCLIITSDYIAAFEKLIKAYGEIAKALPRFDRLSAALRNKPDFQPVLALVYCDIIEFHRAAYRMFNFGAWRNFFDTSWKRFDVKFGGILQNLKAHSDLVDREANAYGIASTVEAVSLLHNTREKVHDSITALEKSRADREFEAALAWLNIQDTQEDDFYRLTAKNLTGTCDWLCRHRLIDRWTCQVPRNPRDSKLWVYGKPGSGKSVLSAHLIRHLQSLKTYSVTYHLCSYRSGSRDEATVLLRSMAHQLLRQRPDLSGFVYDEYIRAGQRPSSTAIKSLVVHLTSAMRPARLIVDGLDECPETVQKEVLKLVTSLTDDQSNGGNCKFALFSREVPIIHKELIKQPSISLSEERDAVDHAISVFVRHEIERFKDEQQDLQASDLVYKQLEQQITEKADGMFLWASLVLRSLDDAYSLQELKKVVDRLPPGLENAYSRIIDNLHTELTPEAARRAVSLFTWIAFAERPLLTHELLDAIALSTHPHVLSEDTKLARRLLDLGKPLIEIADDSTVRFVHFTVREFLLDKMSGPCLTPPAAHQELSLACTASVKQSLDIIDPETDRMVLLQRFVSGLYGFHDYAFNHWTEHLLQHADQKVKPPDDGTSSDTLQTLFYELVRVHDRLLEFYQRPRLVPAIAVGQETNIRKLTVLEGFLSLMHAWDEDMMIETGEISMELWRTFDSIGTAPSDTHKTLLPHVSKCYKALVYLLLSSETLPDLDTALVAEFRIRYAPAAFTCRTPGCPRKSSGFAFAEVRDKHEEIHLPRILCTEPSCHFASAIGFRTAKDVKRHVDKFHPTKKFELPSFGVGQSRILKHDRSKQDRFKNSRRTLFAEQYEALEGRSMNHLETSEQIHCICGFTHDDGWTVACDQCNRWQHQACYYPDYMGSLPNDIQHRCVECKPRHDLDIEAAIKHQVRKHGRQRVAAGEQAEGSNKERHVKSMLHLAAADTDGWAPSPKRSRMDGAGTGTTDMTRGEPTAAAKQVASSYWSVPEQEEFFKYIAYFGTDFSAIATHMGTKTPTMLRNHYQRQIDGGRADIKEFANRANARIRRGEDSSPPTPNIGSPPTPTLITKREYDGPPATPA